MFKAGDYVRDRWFEVHYVVFDSMDLLLTPPKNVTQCSDGVFNTEDLTYWRPKEGELCIFVDLNNNIFIDIFDSIEDDMYISKNYHITENYCGCCAEKEPYIKENAFYKCYPYLGNVIPEMLRN